MSIHSIDFWRETRLEKTIEIERSNLGKYQLSIEKIHRSNFPSTYTLESTIKITINSISHLRYPSQSSLSIRPWSRSINAKESSLLCTFDFLLSFFIIFTIFQQYHSLQWNDITNDHLHSIDDHYPLLSAREDFRDNSEENLDNPTEEEVWWLLCSFTCFISHFDERMWRNKKTHRARATEREREKKSRTQIRHFYCCYQVFSASSSFKCI